MSNFLGASGGASVDQLLQMGINNAKEGNPEGAKVLLKQVIQQDKRNDTAWAWLARLEDDPLMKKRFLQNAVRINPNNRFARETLNKIEAKKESSTRQTMILGSIGVGIMVLLSVLACVAVLIN